MYSKEALSARDLGPNQIEALWILADGRGYSNRDLSKKLLPRWKWKKNKVKTQTASLTEGGCYRDVTKPLSDCGLVFSQSRKGKMTVTGEHDEKAYYIKRIALNVVHSVLKDQYCRLYRNHLNDTSVYKRGLLPPEEKKQYIYACAKFQRLALLELELNAYNDSLQALVDHGITKSPDNPEAAGFSYGYLSPNEKYFFLGKSIAEIKALGITRLSISYP